MRILIAVLAMAVAACGGDDPNDGADPGTGGTGGDTNELCATYHPDPRTDPGYERTDCVPEDWEGTGFCWRTADEPSCLRDGAVAIGCMFVREGATGAPVGTQTSGCVVATECIPGAIDNPECCGGARPDLDSGWDCPTL